MKTATIKAGESRVVIRRQFSSVPMDYRFSAQAVDADSEPSGSIEISRRRLFAKIPNETTQLKAENVVSAGLWDTFVTVTVHADRDLVITSKGRLPD